MSKKRVLITGCCGFIGSQLSKAMVAAGYSVGGVDDESTGDVGSLLDELDQNTVRTVPSWFIPAWEEKNEVTDDSMDFVLFRDDFASPSIISRIVRGKYDVVIHLAAHPSVEQSVNFPVSTHSNNTQKSADLFYACSRSNTRLVFASSAAVYGVDGKMSEVSPCQPKSPYALQKLQCEQIAELYSGLYGLKFAALRFFNVYGPTQSGEGAYSTVMAAWRNRLMNKLPLRLDGDGKQTRDYVHIDDVVTAICNAVEKNDAVGVFNIATGVETSNQEILDAIGEKHNFELTRAPARKGDITHSCAYVEKARDVLDFTAEINIVDGIKTMFSERG